MAKMARRISLLLFNLLVFNAAAKDLFRPETSRKSNKVLVKYEGTLDEVKVYGSSLGLKFKREVFKDWYVFTIPQTDPLVLRDVPDLHIDLWKEQKRDKKVKFIQQERVVSRKPRALTINDPEWVNQWHLQPMQSPNMNVYKAWEKGFTGKGITVTIVDDGIDTEHPDLIKQYNSSLSYDYVADTPDPSHKQPFEGNSWGPSDDGATMEGLDEVLQEAFELTIKEGRNGKGVIYTWGSGNGGYDDNCNADAYSSSMYTIAITAVDETGSKTSYSEPCTSILAATFSGDDGLRNISTAGPNGTCVDDFDGTSAACPMATGIIAMALQANSNLTWRDIQHMIVEFSNFSELVHTNETSGHYDFYTNGAGKPVSIWAGFGLMDAQAMVDNAPVWSTVPPRLSCSSGDLYINRKSADKVDVFHNVSNCYINYVEHVQITAFYNSSFRGDVEFYLLSPMTTMSLIYSRRPYDTYSGPMDYTFMSVHTWGEDPNGEWTLTIYSDSGTIDMNLYHWRLDIFGTATDPLAGTPSEGTFGSPCNNTSSCTFVDGGGCLKDSNKMCDNICVPCNNGYHFNGAYCEKDRFWLTPEFSSTLESTFQLHFDRSKAICKLKRDAFKCARDCPPLLFDGGYVVYTHASEVIIATYSCYFDLGYSSMTGNETRTCGSDGIWTGMEPTCYPLVCEPLDHLENGVVSYDNTTLNSNAGYTCDKGFAISHGDEVRMCSWDGEWSGTKPTCSRYCEPLERPENGNVHFGDEPVFQDSEANYTCDEGYILSEGDARRTCGPDGNWSSVEPECLIDCGPLTSPQNGNVSFMETLQGSEAVYTCEEGYKASEGDAKRTCQPDGQWSSVPLMCFIDCGQPGSLKNGNVSLTGTFQGSVVLYTCMEGFILTKGNARRTCGPDGNWSSVEPECLIDCGPLTKTANGTLSVTSTTEGSKATYSCTTGFAVSSGNMLRTCNSNGRWTGIEPVCDIDCGPLENPDNGMVSLTSTTERSEAIYTCRSGYTLGSVSSTRRCDTSGNWTGTKPKCVFEEPTEKKEDSSRVIGIVVGSVIGGIIIIVIVTGLILYNISHKKSVYLASK